MADKDIYGSDPAGSFDKNDGIDLLDSQRVGTPDRNRASDSRATTDLSFPDIPVRKGK